MFFSMKFYLISIKMSMKRPRYVSDVSMVFSATVRSNKRFYFEYFLNILLYDPSVPNGDKECGI